MARKADTRRAPGYGERMIFLERPRETDGEYATFELRVRPHGFVAAATSTLTRRSPSRYAPARSLSWWTAKRTCAGRGRATVPAGVVHAWWNSGDEEGVAIVEFRPGWKTEEFFESFFGLAQDGKVNPNTGLPNLLWLAPSSATTTTSGTSPVRPSSCNAPSSPPSRRGAAARIQDAALLPIRARADRKAESGGRHVAGRSAGGRRGIRAEARIAIRERKNR